MAERAQVTSSDALELFRSNLLLYLDKARPALDEVSAEVMRMRNWLEDEQRVYWESQVRRRRREFDEARQALFSAKLSLLDRASSAEQMMAHRARRALQAAEEKLRKVKQWDRVFESRTAPLVKQMEKLHTVLAHDMVKAVAFLTRTLETLEAYRRVAPPASAGATRASGETPSPGGAP